MGEMSLSRGFLTELERALAEAGLRLTEDQLGRMDSFQQLVLYWNERLNLTRITSDREMAVKHFVDSLALTRYVSMPPRSSIVDVGSGAGFPGIPLKLSDESLSVTVVESARKKADFLRQACNKLGISVGVVNERAEDMGSDLQHREAYDLAVARAVGEFAVLCEYCLPLVRVGGSFAAMKGPNARDEIDRGCRAIELLGGYLSSLHEYDLPHEMGRRTLAVVTKVSSTPSTYPRRAGTPKKHPL